MVIQQIPVVSQPFQGSLELLFPNTSSINSTDVSFINDGYTVLYILVNLDGADTTDLTIKSVPDNAGRLGDITKTFTADDNGVVFTAGPFRPIWWNFGGVVNITFSDIYDGEDPPGLLDIRATAVKYQF